MKESWGSIPARLPPPGTMLDIACRSCSGRCVEFFLNLWDQPHCNQLVRPDAPLGAESLHPLRVGFCHDCSLVQIDWTIPKAEMFSDYPYVSGTTRTLTEHFRQTAARLAQTFDLQPRDLVVDIGSNDGSWLKQYATFGLSVLGVEAAANIADLAQAAGVPTLNRFFNEDVAREIVAHHGDVKLVTAAGVFFHLEELHSVIRGVDLLIGDEGVFVVQAIYLGGMITNTAFDQIYHEHLCYYTLRSLGRLFARHGLEVFGTSLIPIHGGTIEVHVARKGRRTIAPSVQALLDKEHRGGLDGIETYRTFAGRVVSLGRRLHELLSRYRAEGRSVWAYGAPAKGATLLNSFGIGPDLVGRAVEKNPMKIGLAIPGCRIPIVAEGGERPHAYLMLAWNFLDEFLEKERPFIESGGEFIVPVPELRVIGRSDLRTAS